MKKTTNSTHLDNDVTNSDSKNAAEKPDSQRMDDRDQFAGLTLDTGRDTTAKTDYEKDLFGEPEASDDFELDGMDSFLYETVSLGAELGKSLEKTLDITKEMDLALKMSDHDQSRREKEKIFNDPKLSREEAQRLSAEVDARQMKKDEHAVEQIIRMQSSKGDTVGKILKSPGVIVLSVGGGVMLGLLFGTATGRSILKKATGWIAKEGPHHISQVAA